MRPPEGTQALSTPNPAPIDELQSQFEKLLAYSQNYAATLPRTTLNRTAMICTELQTLAATRQKHQLAYKFQTLSAMSKQLSEASGVDPEKQRTMVLNALNLMREALADLQD